MRRCRQDYDLKAAIRPAIISGLVQEEHELQHVLGGGSRRETKEEAVDHLFQCGCNKALSELRSKNRRRGRQ
jgi:hypothetical protein